MTEPNWDIYNYVLLAFEGLQKDDHRKKEYYKALSDLAEQLELPAGSPVQKGSSHRQGLTTAQAKLVATVLGKRAIDLYFELG